MAWQNLMQLERQKPYFHVLLEFIKTEYKHHTIYPLKNNIFNAFDLTPFDKVRVVILGQDPYHNEHQAHGLAFSVPNNVAKPPSLTNILKELSNDLGMPMPKNSNLTPWAKQGVLLLNTVLTVRKNEPGSHRQKGWEQFTDAVITSLDQQKTPIVFVLWGNDAKNKRKLINNEIHHILTSPHPSPLSAHRGFFGSRPFSNINTFLQHNNLGNIDWDLDFYTQ